MSGKYNKKHSHYGCHCDLYLSKGSRGLGPNSWGNVRHLLPYHIDFNHAAYFHDIAYDLKFIDRQEIDEKFLRLMLKTCGDNKVKIFYAKLYYIGVRLFGWYYFK